MSLLLKLLAWLGPVAGSIRGFINLAELKRVLFSSAVVGAFVGFITAVVTAIQGDLSAIAPNFLVAGIAAKLLTLILDLVRRLNHGAPAPAAFSGK